MFCSFLLLHPPYESPSDATTRLSLMDCGLSTPQAELPAGAESVTKVGVNVEKARITENRSLDLAFGQ